MVAVCATIATPTVEIRFALRLQDEAYLVTKPPSRFTGNFLRGADAPESAVSNIVIIPHDDSTTVTIILTSNQAPFTGSNAHLLDLEVIATTTHEFMALYVYPDTLFDGTAAIIGSASGAWSDLQVDGGFVQSVPFDEFPPPPNDHVILSYLEVSRSAPDTVVSVSVRYFTRFVYGYWSLPIRIKPAGVTAYVVPGSVQPTALAGPADSTGHVLLEFPDSSGFWLQMYNVRSSAYIGSEWSAKPIVQFDIAISGSGAGVVVLDTALAPGIDPYGFVDQCSYEHEVQFIRGTVNVDPVAVQSDFEVLPASFELNSAGPNPFNQSTALLLALDRASTVELSVFNMLGRPVSELWGGWLPAGTHPFTWEASDVASGVYFVRARRGADVQTIKLMLLR